MLKSIFSIFSILNFFSLDVSDEGIECIFKLSEGDMRKVVNMLQV